jgi:predicted dehydrogenase
MKKAVKVDDKCVYAKEVDVDDNTIIVIKYENDVKATYTECHFTPDYKREFVFIGDKGRLSAIDKYLPYQDHEITVTYRHSKKVNRYKPVLLQGAHGGGDIVLIESFIDTIFNNKKPLAGGVEGRDSVVIAEASEKSIATGKVINLIP